MFNTARMDNAIVIKQKKSFKECLPVWLTNIHSLFYYFLFLVLMGVLFFCTSLFTNYFTTPFTGDYCLQQFSFYTNGYDDWWHFLTTGEFVLYDQNTFLGADNIGSNTFYYLFDPFFLPILLVPRQLVPQGMALLTIFKIAASGMTFFIYMRYLGASRTASKISGFAYAFSGWMTWYLWFNHFTEIAIVLPLILLGVEKVIKEKKPWVLAASLCLMGFTNFFFLVCFALCAFLYAMFRYFQTLNTRNWKDNLWVLLFGFLGFLIGILMPMMVVFPATMHALNAPRAKNSGYLFEMTEAFKAANFNKIFRLLTSWKEVGDNGWTFRSEGREVYPFIDFIFPVTSDRGTPLMTFYQDTYDNVAGSTYCFLPMMLLLAPAFVDSLKKRHFSVLIPLLFFIVALFTPACYFLFHGLTEGYSRWTLFVTTSILAYTGLYLDKIKEKPFYELIIGYLFLMAMMITAGLCAMYIVKHYQVNPDNTSRLVFEERVPIWLAMLIEGIYLTVLVGILILFKFVKKVRFYSVFTGFIVLEVALMGAFVIQGHGVEDYYYTNKGVVKNDNLHALVRDVYKDDKSYYRSFSSLGSEIAYNDEMRNGYNGFNMFHSVYNFNTADFCNWSSITHGTAPNSWSGTYVNKRVNPDTLLGVKYYYVEDDYFQYQNRKDATSDDFKYNVPFNYVEITDRYKYRDYRVYQNMDYIDFALTYDRIYEVFGNPNEDGKTQDKYDLYEATSYKNVMLNEEMYMSGAIVNTFRDETLLPYIQDNYPDITIKKPLEYTMSDYYAHSTGSFQTRTIYDMKSARESSLSVPAKEYVELCNPDNDTFKKYTTGLPKDDVDNYRRFVEVIEAKGDNFINYDPRGNVFYITIPFYEHHEADVYFVDINNQIITYDNHNDGFLDSGRTGKEYRAFYITPEYGLDDEGNIVITKDAPKIKKIIIVARHKEFYPFMYDVWIDSYTKHEQKMNKLKEYVVTDVKSSANKYSFKTNFDKNRVVVTRLAYEKGFKLKMIDANGKKQDLKVFNGQGGFVSFISGTGECSYSLEFYTPNLAIGSIVSALSAFVFTSSIVGYLYLDMRKKEKETSHLFSR